MIASRKATLCSLGLLLLVGCGAGEGEDGASAPALAMWPLTTSSDEARRQFTEGQRLDDLGREASEVYPYFQRAIEADSTFALAHLAASGWAPSLAEGRPHLLRAVALADGASEAERLLIQMVNRAAVEGDAVGALELAQQLAQVSADNPRAWMTLAGQQGAVSQIAESRASAVKALELEPNFLPAHLALFDSYVNVPPLDYARAEEHIQKAIALAPSESYPYERLGFLRRFQGRLEEARELDTRAAELAPTRASHVQQRAHVNLFLGDYDAARADYDAAFALGLDNAKGSYAYSRALVGVFAGDPVGAVAELEQLVQAVDGMGLPDADAAKINALVAETFIASYFGLPDRADAALQRLAALWRKRADEIGTDVFRRAREADIAYFEGLVAAYRGDYELASRKVGEFEGHVQQVTNPRRNERAYELRGLVALRQGNYPEAVTQYEQMFKTYFTSGVVGTLDPYHSYQHGLALEGAGRTAEAGELFSRVASQYGASLGAALVRKDATAKVPPP